MSEGFIRAVWGDVSSNGMRDGKLRKDIDNVKQLTKDNPDFIKGTVYVFGEENAKILTEDGFECILIDEKPSRWNMKKHLYRHKLDVFSRATADYDEIVYLDWDCVQHKPIPSYFWKRMREREPFQANLMQYRTKKCLWRNEDHRKVPNGGFVYIGNHEIPEKLIRKWNELFVTVLELEDKRRKKGKELRFREKSLVFDDEPAMGKYVDDCTDGWKGIDTYWNLFEPDFCNLGRKSVFPDYAINAKEECFRHFPKERLR